MEQKQSGVLGQNTCKMKIKGFTLALALFWPMISFAQLLKIQIVNSQNKEPIAHVAVFSKDNKEGTYADEKGNVQFEFNPSTDTILFSAIGFELLRLSLKQAQQNNNVALNPVVLNLPDVTISSNQAKIEEKSFGFFKRFRGLPGFAVYSNMNNPYALLVNNPNEQTGWINKIRIRFAVSSSKIADTYRIQLRIYKNENGKPGEDLFTLPFVNINPSQQSLEQEIPERQLLFPKEGVFIGYDALGYTDQKGTYHSFKRGQKVPIGKKGEWSDYLAPGVAIDKKHKQVEVFEANGLGAWYKSFMVRWGVPMFGVVVSSPSTK